MADDGFSMVIPDELFENLKQVGEPLPNVISTDQKIGTYDQDLIKEQKKLQTFLKKSKINPIIRPDEKRFYQGIGQIIFSQTEEMLKSIRKEYIKKHPFRKKKEKEKKESILSKPVDFVKKHKTLTTLTAIAALLGILGVLFKDKIFNYVVQRKKAIESNGYPIEIIKRFFGKGGGYQRLLTESFKNFDPTQDYQKAMAEIISTQNDAITEGFKQGAIAAQKFSESLPQSQISNLHSIILSDKKSFFSNLLTLRFKDKTGKIVHIRTDENEENLKVMVDANKDGRVETVIQTFDLRTNKGFSDAINYINQLDLETKTNIDKVQIDVIKDGKTERDSLLRSLLDKNNKNFQFSYATKKNDEKQLRLYKQVVRERITSQKNFNTKQGMLMARQEYFISEVTSQTETEGSFKTILENAIRLKEYIPRQMREGLIPDFIEVGQVISSYCGNVIFDKISPPKTKFESKTSNANLGSENNSQLAYEKTVSYDSSKKTQFDIVCDLRTIIPYTEAILRESELRKEKLKRVKEENQNMSFSIELIDNILVHIGELSSEDKITSKPKEVTKVNTIILPMEINEPQQAELAADRGE